MRSSAITAFVLGLCFCVPATADPNVGETSVDFVMSQGNCAKAIELAEPAAIRGEPWAQYRMGMILIDKRCPPAKWKDAIGWLEKAATYHAESAWEKGAELSLGPTGYFNARASATNAAVALGETYAAARYPAMNWYWLKRAASQFSSDEKDGAELFRTVSALEKAVSQADQEKIAKHWDSKLPWHK